MEQHGYHYLPFSNSHMVIIIFPSVIAKQTMEAKWLVSLLPEVPKVVRGPEPTPLALLLAPTKLWH
jgi:hypothetical protein